MKDENVKGAATAFCTFTPFKCWTASLWHRVVLRVAPVNSEKIRALRFLHHMCFAIVTARALKRAQLPAAGDLASGAMLFISAYNGGAEPYFRGFSNNLAEEMHELWRGCVDWKGAHDYEALEKFIESHRRRSNFYFNAYPDSSVNLRTALRLRAELDDLIASAHRAPAQFLDGYRRAAQRAWGNLA